MPIKRTIGRGPVIVATLAYLTIIFLGLATTIHVSATNTLSPLPETKTAEAVPAPNDTVTKITLLSSGLDTAMGVLAPEDALLYRSIFEAQKQEDWSKADSAIESLTDKRLMGHVLADRYQRRSPSIDEIAFWLKEYGDLPQAEALYNQRQKAAKQAGLSLPPPRSPDLWNGGYVADSAADFPAEMTAATLSQQTEAGRLARAMNKALRRHDPFTARDMLVAAEARQQLVGTFAADAEAAVAAGFFYVGERDQARSLSTAAAATGQPLGLWIRGLIAWEQNDFETASTQFTRLADHPALNPGSRAASHFWAYRALSRKGSKKEAYAHLDKASHQQRSFYGLLAAQLLERGPETGAANPKSLPVWAPHHREVLISTETGWRALALIQVGETTLAENELRRLNPLSQDNLPQAMLALAGYVPMPALAVQLASLNGGQSYAAAYYPLPSWQPQKGFQIDRALLYALMRHESQFDPSAISRRGACGLMQIMPKTAEAVLDDSMEEETLSTKGKLFDPSFNLALGQKYVQHLAALPQIRDNLILLLAAYNGGPNKVSRWMGDGTARQEKLAQDPLLFMESLPARETRNYIARVLPHYWGYQARLAQPRTSLKQLAEGKWPRMPVVGTSVQQAEANKVTDGIRMASNQPFYRVNK